MGGQDQRGYIRVRGVCMPTRLGIHPDINAMLGRTITVTATVTTDVTTPLNLKLVAKARQRGTILEEYPVPCCILASLLWVHFRTTPYVLY